MNSMMDPADRKMLAEHGFKEPHLVEVAKDQLMEVNWPDPNMSFRLIVDSWKHSIEAIYYWLLDYMRYDIGFTTIYKITDLFSASEQSSFFGLGQQRLGLQQDKVSSFLAIIGKMTKELFQLVRELRILDERLSHYISSKKRDRKIYAVKGNNKDSKSWESAEITLKGFWVDLVEQGTKNPASVYGMAREIQFTTLPDLFFSIHPYDEDMVDPVVDMPDFQKAFNRKVREVLKRKLRTYLVWKKQTEQELLNKRAFTLRYMYQHVHIIKLYMAYVKPYLKNVERLQIDEDMRDSPDLIVAFESSMIEIEILGQFLPEGNEKVWGVMDLHFRYRTKPSLNYNAEGYNRGPIHEGVCEVTYRTYAWTQEQIDSYRKMRSKEDFLLLKVIDKNLDFVLQELGDDLFRYLAEAEKLMTSHYNVKDFVTYNELLGIKKEKKEETKKKSSTNPFTALADGFKDMANAFSSKTPAKPGEPKKEKKPSAEAVHKNAGEVKRANGDASQKVWLAYKNYKKSQGMIAW